MKKIGLLLALLGALAAGDELDVVHEEHVGGAEFLPELLVAALPDGLDQLIGEGVALDVHHPEVGAGGVDFVGDGVEQVGLAQAGLAVDEQRVVALARVFGHGQGGGVGELVGGTYHEALEGVVLGAGEEGAVHGLGGLGEVVQLPLAQDLHLEVGGEELVQGLLDIGDIAFADDVTLEVGGRMDDEAVLLQGHGGAVVKPGVDGCRGHVRFHEGENLGPYIGR